MTRINGNYDKSRPTQSLASRQEAASQAYNDGIWDGVKKQVTTTDGWKEIGKSAAIGFGVGAAATVTVISAPVWGTAAVVGAGLYGVYEGATKIRDTIFERQDDVLSGNIAAAKQHGTETGKTFTNTTASVAGGVAGSATMNTALPKIQSWWNNLTGSKTSPAVIGQPPAETAPSTQPQASAPQATTQPPTPDAANSTSQQPATNPQTQTTSSAQAPTPRVKAEDSLPKNEYQNTELKLKVLEMEKEKLNKQFSDAGELPEPETDAYYDKIEKLDKHIDKIKGSSQYQDNQQKLAKINEELDKINDKKEFASEQEVNKLEAQEELLKKQVEEIKGPDEIKAAYAKKVNQARNKIDYEIDPSPKTKFNNAEEEYTYLENQAKNIWKLMEEKYSQPSQEREALLLKYNQLKDKSDMLYKKITREERPRG